MDTPDPLDPNYQQLHRPYQFGEQEHPPGQNPAPYQQQSHQQHQSSQAYSQSQSTASTGTSSATDPSQEQASMISPSSYGYGYGHIAETAPQPSQPPPNPNSGSASGSGGSGNGSPLDYHTFWQLQQHLGVAPLRDNLNYAAAQNQETDAGVAIYHEPMYAYNGPEVGGSIYSGGDWSGVNAGAGSAYSHGHGHGAGSNAGVAENGGEYWYPQAGHGQGLGAEGQETAHIPQDYMSPTSQSNHSSEYYPAPQHQHQQQQQYEHDHQRGPYQTQPRLSEYNSPMGSYDYQLPSQESSPASHQAQNPPQTLPQTHTFPQFAAPPPRPAVITTIPSHPQISTLLSPSKNSSQSQSQSSSAAAAKRKPTLTTKRKRQRTSKVQKGRGRDRDDDDSSGSDDDDDDLEGNGKDKIGKGPDGKPVRLPGACTHCKKLKMRCEFESPMDIVCKRCRNTRHQCIVEGRKPRTQPNKREFLLAQIRQKDQIIEKLLKQIHGPKLNEGLDFDLDANPDVVAWIRNAQASVRAGQRPFVLDGRADRDTNDAASDGESDDFGGGGVGGPFAGPGVNGPGNGEGLLSVRAAHEPGSPADRERLHSLPDPSAPLGLIAKLALSSRSRSRSVSSNGRSDTPANDNPNDPNDNNFGVANEGYFLPGPAANLDLRAALLVSQPPEIMVHGLVTPEDVDNLFQIFYEKLNPFLSILDPVLHTPASTFSRCPFLFTVICAISSRYYVAKSSIYPIAMHFAKQAAAKNLIEGWKCVELCQAYILMSTYSMPAKKWEDDRSWLYLGLAIRIATDLNLHHPTAMKVQNELHEREILNRTRTWMILFNLDRSTSTQLGKPSTIREDYIIHNSEDWYLKSSYNHAYDVHLCAYAQLLRIVAQFHSQVLQGPLGFKPDLDTQKLVLQFDVDLERFWERTAEIFDRYTDRSDAGAVFRTKLLPFIVNYARLVLFSFAFQKAFQQGLKHDDPFLEKCLSAASAVLKTFIERLAPSGYMRYSPDGHFVFVSFACAFLIKLLRADLIAEGRKQSVVDSIIRLTEALSSSDVAIDDRHTPKLYARFLRSLLADQDGSTDGGKAANGEGPSGGDMNGDGGTPSDEDDRDVKRHAPPAEQEPDNPSISVEYGASGGDSHVELLQDSHGHPSHQYRPTVHNSRTHMAHYDERLSTTASSTVGDNAADTETQHSALSLHDDQMQVSQEDMLATMQILSNPGFFDHMLMPPFNPALWTTLPAAQPEHYADPHFPANTAPPAQQSYLANNYQQVAPIQYQG